MVKFFKVVLAAALISCASSASAQFTGGNVKSGKSSSTVADTNPYNRLTLSYENVHLGANDKMEGYFNDEDAVGLNGVGLEYTHGFSVSKTLPMFIEAGIKMQFATGSVGQDETINVEGHRFDCEYIAKYQTLSFVVPINYTYRFPVGEDMNIAPYLGINFKVHGIGQYKEQIKFDDDDLQDAWDDSKDKLEDWKNVFDKKDMGDKDATWNRFQMGWQIGLGFNVKSFYVGLQYGTDFIPAFKYKKYAINTGTFSAKLGVCF